MKKKLFSILLVLCLCVSVFAGCSLVEIDEKSYQEAIVTTITYTDGEVDNIDKRELLLAYSSYGYNYNSDGSNYNGAIDQTLSSVIDQHITIKAVKNYYKNLPENNDEIEENDEPLLNDNETSYLWEQTRSSLFDNIEQNYFKILDFEAGQSEEDTTTEEGVVYNKYSSSVELKDGVIRTKETTFSTRNNNDNLKVLPVDEKTYVYDYESEEYDFKTELFNALYNAMGEDTKVRAVRDWRSAISQYVDVVERNFSYLNYKTDAEWLKFEIDRVYDILKNNYLVEKYTEIYNKAQDRKDNFANIQVKDVLNRYKEKVEQDYITYKNSPSSYSDAILNNTADVDYFLKTNNQNYFYVSAIKVNISAAQQKLLDEAAKSGNPLDKVNAEKTVFEDVLATERDVNVDFDGNSTGKGGRTSNKITVTELRDNLEAAISRIEYKTADDMSETQTKEALSVLSGEDKEDPQKQAEAIEQWLANENAVAQRQRAAIFRNYMFKYSDDDTTKNSDYAMVFGFDGNTNSVLANSTFAENGNVKDAIKALYKSNPEVGDTTDLVKVDDGYYIFFYAGEVEQIAEVSDGNLVLDEDFIYKLRGTRTSLFSDKTLFDVLYDELYSNYSDNFSVFQNLDIAALNSKDQNDRKIVESIQKFGDELYN